MGAVQFNKVTRGYAVTLAPAGKYPIVGDRIFATLQDAQDYVDGNGASKTAIPGIYLSVIADGDNNGAYWVAQAAGYDGATVGILQKMGEGGGSSSGGGGSSAEVTYDSVVNALGFTPMDSSDFTKANIKSTLGIYNWALASSKPSYTFAEITSKPTTLSGYGVTNVDVGTVTASMISLPIPSGGSIPRFRIFADNDLVYFQAAQSDGVTQTGSLYISGMYNATLEMVRIISKKVGINTVPSQALDVNGLIKSTNYMVGGYLEADPTSSFATTIFGSAESSYCKMRLMRKGAATDRFNFGYAPILALKTFDTHGFISIAYNKASQCYIGGGSSDAISWSAILYNDDMSLIPYKDAEYVIGDSSHRYKSLMVSDSIKIGDAILSWDSSAGMLKIDKGVYSTGAITAGGVA